MYISLDIHCLKFIQPLNCRFMYFAKFEFFNDYFFGCFCSPTSSLSPSVILMTQVLDLLLYSQKSLGFWFCVSFCFCFCFFCFSLFFMLLRLISVILLQVHGFLSLSSSFSCWAHPLKDLSKLLYFSVVKFSFGTLLFLSLRHGLFLLVSSMLIIAHWSTFMIIALNAGQIFPKSVSCWCCCL